jgi:hypothetical protein
VATDRVRKAHHPSAGYANSRRIAATIYHLFLAEDNSQELFGQLKRIHSLFPYSIVKNIVRFANPIALFPRILDVFMAQPFGSRSLLQHIFGMAIQDGINNVQKSVTVLITHKIQDPDFPLRIQLYVDLDEEMKSAVKQHAKLNDVDLILEILQSPLFGDPLSHDQISTATEAYASWKRAVENVGSERTSDAELYAHMKQLLKLYLRQRDKVKMLEMINEVRLLRHHVDPVTRFILFLLVREGFYGSAIRLLVMAKIQASREKTWIFACIKGLTEHYVCPLWCHGHAIAFLCTLLTLLTPKHHVSIHLLTSSS